MRFIIVAVVKQSCVGSSQLFTGYLQAFSANGILLIKVVGINIEAHFLHIIYQIGITFCVLQLSDGLNSWCIKGHRNGIFKRYITRIGICRIGNYIIGSDIGCWLIGYDMRCRPAQNFKGLYIIKYRLN